MIREKSAVKPLAYALAVFLTLGITIANETLSRFGLEGNYLVMFSTAFIMAALLLGQSPWLLVLLGVGVVLINQPEEFLALYSLDRDLLLAALCALIVVPMFYRQLSK